MEENVVNKQITDKKALVKWSIMILIGVLIMLTPVNDVYTQKIKIFLTITICAILTIAFELTPTIIIQPVGCVQPLNAVVGHNLPAG